MNLQSFIIYSI